MLKSSHWMAIGSVVFAGVVLAAVPLVQRANVGAPPDSAVSAEPTATVETPVRPSTTKLQQHPAASLTRLEAGSLRAASA